MVVREWKTWKDRQRFKYYVDWFRNTATIVRDNLKRARSRIGLAIRSAVRNVDWKKLTLDTANFLAEILSWGLLGNIATHWIAHWDIGVMQVLAHGCALWLARDFIKSIQKPHAPPTEQLHQAPSGRTK